MTTVGPEQEDRGVEPDEEIVWKDGKRIVRRRPHAIDGLGNPAAPEEDLGD